MGRTAPLEAPAVRLRTEAPVVVNELSAQEQRRYRRRVKSVMRRGERPLRGIVCETCQHLLPVTGYSADGWELCKCGPFTTDAEITAAHGVPPELWRGANFKVTE